MTQQIKHMGVLAYFRGSDVWITPSDMQKTLDAAGVTQAVPDLDKTAAGRASFAARNFRSPTAGGSVRVDTLERGTETASYGLLRKTEITRGAEVRWVQFDSVTWTRAAGWVSAHNSTESREFIAFAQKCQTHLDYYWLRGVAYDHLRKVGGFAMSGGGIQYVHGDLLPAFKQVQDAINGVPGAHLHAIKLDPKDEETRQAVGNAATEHLEAQIRDVMSRLDAWREKAGRPSTVANLTSDLAEIRGRAIALSTALAFSADAIDAKIAAVEADLTKATAEAEVRAAAAATTTEEPAKAPKAAKAPKTVETAASDDENGTVGDIDAILASFPSTEALETSSSKQLKTWGREYGVKGYAKMKPEALVQALLDRREQLSEQA